MSIKIYLLILFLSSSCGAPDLPDASGVATEDDESIEELGTNIPLHTPDRRFRLSSRRSIQHIDRVLEKVSLALGSQILEQTESRSSKDENKDTTTFNDAYAGIGQKKVARITVCSSQNSRKRTGDINMIRFGYRDGSFISHGFPAKGSNKTRTLAERRNRHSCAYVNLRTSSRISQIQLYSWEGNLSGIRIRIRGERSLRGGRTRDRSPLRIKGNIIGLYGKLDRKKGDTRFSQLGAILAGKPVAFHLADDKYKNHIRKVHANVVGARTIESDYSDCLIGALDPNGRCKKNRRLGLYPRQFRYGWNYEAAFEISKTLAFKQQVYLINWNDDIRKIWNLKLQDLIKQSFYDEDQSDPVLFYEKARGRFD